MCALGVDGVAAQGTLGVATHSNALIADAMHSLSDLLSDFVTLWSVRVARLPPDPKHPYGRLRSAIRMEYTAENTPNSH